MKTQLAVALALTMGTLMPVVAQDKPQLAVPPPAASSGARQTPLKVQLTLTRFLGEKKISSVPYMLGVLTNHQKTSLRMGVQVPIVQTVFAGKSDAYTPQTSFSYRDVGTNIDCQAHEAGNGLYTLVITVEDSAIQLDRSPDTPEDKKVLRDIPAFRSFRASFAMVLRDGQTMQYASATDPVSGEVMRIDVTLSLAK
jgi:hypothetical protein